jgi:hypothetical protein
LKQLDITNCLRIKVMLVANLFTAFALSMGREFRSIELKHIRKKAKLEDLNLTAEEQMIAEAAKRRPVPDLDDDKQKPKRKTSKKEKWTFDDARETASAKLRNQRIRHNLAAAHERARIKEEEERERGERRKETGKGLNLN